MKATAVVQKPDDIEVTMSFTMPLSAWKRLKDSLGKIPHGGSDSYPMWDIRRAIVDLVVRCEKSLDAEPPAPAVEVDKASSGMQQAVPTLLPQAAPVDAVATKTVAAPPSEAGRRRPQTMAVQA